MLPKKQRIQRKNFALLREKGRVFKNSLFSLKFLEKEGPSRFSFSISKKVAKGAAERNKLRRLGYRFIGNRLDMIQSGIWVHFSFLRKPQNKEEAVQELQSILKRSKLMK